MSGYYSRQEPYIDEYGINHGPGVKIGETVWAPVNCGYHATDYKYGKLYQWGRKYGQGYSGDATIPELVEGPVSLRLGQNTINAVNFYCNPNTPYDWLDIQDANLWNSGSEENPIKTEYDPCPEGWRVPTCAELNALISKYSSWITNENGYAGYWFSGSEAYSESKYHVFLSVAGFRGYYAGIALYRGDTGYYWCSKASRYFSSRLGFNSSGTNISDWERSNGYSVRCVQDDSPMVLVESVNLSKTSTTLSVGESETLSAAILPSNANHQHAHWSSDDSSVVTVDSEGKITAVSAGAATITAMAGMQVATCKVTVNAVPSEPVEPKEGDYIDEYGINHGPGVKIGETVWAPVNCGYHATDYKYGKLYQWGRKYGQGYDDDASVPEIVAGPVSLSVGQSEANAGKFYYNYNSNSSWDWLTPQDDNLWNSGTEDNPVKTEYDPCPDGWRVPTYSELSELSTNYSFWTTDENDQTGYWFSGTEPYSESVPRVFFPAAGYHYYYIGTANNRGDYGYYWSSRANGHNANHLTFYSINVGMYSSYRANGFSVRCLQVTD